MRRHSSRLTACFLTLLVLAPAAWALPSDQKKPIHIEADEALRDENQGFTRYSGNVSLQQGSLQIRADQLTVYHRGEDAQRISAIGRPANLQQQPDVDKGVITARANRIEYFRDEARVELREAASIEQEGSTVTGDKIDYFINQKLVRADSDRSDNSSRVQVVIPAQALQADTDSEQRDDAAESEPAAPESSNPSPAEAASGATESP